MSFIDYFALAIIAGLVILAIRHRRKHPTCCQDCKTCKKSCQK